MYKRHWVANCNYKGKKDFKLGTISIEHTAKEHEIQEKFQELWKAISPYPFPDSYKLTPGMLVFVEEK